MRHVTPGLMSATTRATPSHRRLTSSTIGLIACAIRRQTRNGGDSQRWEEHMRSYDPW